MVAEVKGEVPVYVDGGIRSGADVFKALALGKLLSKKIYVTQHHQMRHKSHTKVLSKWQIKEEGQNLQNIILLKI